MLNLPIVPTQVTLRGNVISLDHPRVQNYSHDLALGAGYCTERVANGLKNSAKNRRSQWYAQSALCAHTGHVKGKCGFSRRSWTAHQFTVGPRGRVMN